MLSLNLKQISQILRKGKLSSIELCKLSLNRMQEMQELNIFITELPTLALQQARESQIKIDKGSNSLLEGIPIAIKDNFITKNIKTTCASKMLENYFPPFDATVVNKLRNQGCIIVGKTNMDEFGMGCGSVDGAFGPVKNPWNYCFSSKVKTNFLEDVESKINNNLQNQNNKFFKKEDKFLANDYTIANNIEPISRIDQILDEDIQSKFKNEIYKSTNRLSNYQNSLEKSTNNSNLLNFIGEMGSNLKLTSNNSASDWYIAGGSSGGSAVSVATGTVFAAIGSDTGGSTRNPASYCGVVGLKPSYGRISRHGLIPLVNSMDVPGLLTRCVDDAAILLNILSGHDSLDSTTLKMNYTNIELPNDLTVKGFTIGIPKEYHSPGLSPETLKYWDEIANLLEKSGAKVVKVSMAHTQQSIACYHVLCACEVASNMCRYDGLRYGHRLNIDLSTNSLFAITRHDGFNDVVRSRILAGNFFLLKQNYENYFLRAQKVRRLIKQDFEKVFSSGVDVLLTPTVLGSAPLFSQFSSLDNRTRTQEEDVFTQPANMAGVPAISIPVGLSRSGLPIGLQLMAPYMQDELLLRVAKFIENKIEFSQFVENYPVGNL